MIPLSLFWLVRWTRTHSRQTARQLLYGMAIAVPLLELMRILWLIWLGEGYWVKLLPLHLCGLQVFPFFHFQTFQSFALHLLLILAPVLMFLADDYSPRLSQLPSVIAILGGSALCAFAVDWIWGQNYMFLREVPEIGFLQAIMKLGGYPAYWLTLGAAVIAGCTLLLAFGQDWKKRD